MRRLGAFILLLVGLAGGPIARANDAADLLKALALQKVVLKTIQQNEASIACILVSRSEVHPRNLQYPGKLGIYDPSQIKRDPNTSEKDYLLKQKRHDLADTGNIPQAFGSGVVIDADGLILTNYHVVQDATKIYVRLPGGKGAYADIHAADPRSDLAVLKLLGDVRLLKAVALGDADKLERGQFVLTLSNPFAAGFHDGQPSASWGILSNIRRRAATHLKEEDRVKPFHYYSTLLQTDARLHLGCSGGALLNLQGEMIGLITALAAIQGGETPGGFAIPINAGMRRIIDVLKRGEEVDYGFLGVGFNISSANDHGPLGIALTTIGPGTPAKVQGKLEEGDILLAVNGQPIHSSDEIFVTLGTHLAGSNVRLLVRHKNQERAVDVTLAKLYVPGKKIASSLGSRPYFRGLRVDYSSLLAQQFRQATLPGVAVTEVQVNTSADRANLKTSDVITHVNQRPVTTPGAFYQAVADVRGPIELTLQNHPQEQPIRVLLK